MIRKLLFAIFASAIGLMLAALLVPGVEVIGEFGQSLKTLLLAGVVLGLINFFIKPVLNLITLPLRIITFGLFSLVINMAIVWLIVLVFGPSLSINGLKALFLTAVLIWLCNFITPKDKKKR